MKEIEEKIQSLINQQIDYKGEIVTVRKGKITSTMIVLITDKFPVNYPKYSNEFKNLKPIPRLEKMQNQENQVTVITSKPLTNSNAVNQSLNGYEKLNSLLDNLLDDYNTGDDKAKEKIKSDLDVVIPIANAKINLFKVGLTAVSLANKI